MNTSNYVVMWSLAEPIADRNELSGPSFDVDGRVREPCTFADRVIKLDPVASSECDGFVGVSKMPVTKLLCNKPELYYRNATTNTRSWCCMTLRYLHVLLW